MHFGSCIFQFLWCKQFMAYTPIWREHGFSYGCPWKSFGSSKNVLFGHIISACSGVFIYSILGFSFLSLGLGVGLAIFLMMTTKTVHPPAGANPIIAILGAKGLDFIIIPVAVGAFFIVLFAIIYNKLLKRKYFTLSDLRK